MVYNDYISYNNYYCIGNNYIYLYIIYLFTDCWILENHNNINTNLNWKLIHPTNYSIFRINNIGIYKL